MTVERLARGWIEAWQRMDMEWLRKHLAEDFVHESPFGRLEGREHYLAVVEPAARRSVAELVLVDVVAQGDRAAVQFVNRGRGGDIPSCDWVTVQGGTIRSIRSFYDAARVREVLSPEEQRELDDGPA